MKKLALLAVLSTAFEAHAFVPACHGGTAATLARSRSSMPCMGDVVVKFPGGRSATVPEGSPLSLAAYQAGVGVT